MVHWRLENESIREFLAEFLGTLVLVVIGCCGNANANLSNSVAGGVMVPMIWGLVSNFGLHIF